jgi:hypothetical protein
LFGFFFKSFGDGEAWQCGRLMEFFGWERVGGYLMSCIA